MSDRSNQTPAPESDHAGLVRTVAYGDWLTIGVVLLQQLLARAAPSTPLAVALLAFGAVSVTLRLGAGGALNTLLRVELQAWALAAFIAFAVWHSGGADSPLQALYVLPLALAALALSGARLLAFVVAIAGACALTATLRSGLDLAAAAAGRLPATVIPLALVAWLVSRLTWAAFRERRRATALSDYDALTGLVSRRAYLQAVRETLAAAATPCAALVVDLEGLQRLNEQSGYEAGNAALKLVAEALRRVLRDGDVAARWGGDEFAVLLRGSDLAAAHAAGARVRSAVQAATLEVAGRHLRCRVSVGCAASPRDGRSGEALLSSAERRLGRERELRRQTPAGVVASG